MVERTFAVRSAMTCLHGYGAEVNSLVAITMLNSMAGSDFRQSLDVQKQWGISALDLKNEIFGKSIIDLDAVEAKRAAAAIRERDMTVYCFSTELFGDDIERGEAWFRQHHWGRVRQTIAVADVLRPTVIRLLAARSGRRKQFADSVAYVRQHHPWLIPMYRQAIDMIAAAGFRATIENECPDSIFAHPDEIIAFFRELNREDKGFFTYDVQNLWEMGTFPTLDVYRRLAPLIGYYHVKGGIKAEDPGMELAWASSLEDASWPVAAMTQQAVDDGRISAICLNPSHGKRQPDFDYYPVVKRDLDYIRQHVRGVE